MIKTIRYWIVKAAGVSKGEANSLLILIPLLIITIVAPPIVRRYHTSSYSNYDTDKAILDSLLASIDRDVSRDKLKDSEKIIYKPFDPNTSSAELLISNGIPKYLADRIISYTNKGGQFRKKEDLKKIYGFKEELYESVAPHIVISQREQIKKPRQSHIPKVVKIESFDINIADTSTLKQVYGIGDKLSMRIINFRDKLGGFINTGQLHQVYGLKAEVIDSLLAYGIIKDGHIPLQVNINTDSVRLLSSHPYIDYKLAKTIVSYRRQHGNYSQPSDLKKIHLVNDSTINVIVPYLKMSD